MTKLGIITTVDPATARVSPQTGGVAAAVAADAASNGEAIVDTIELSANGLAAASTNEKSEAADGGVAGDATAATTGIVVEALKIVAEQQQYAADVLADMTEQLGQVAESGKGVLVDTVA